MTLYKPLMTEKEIRKRKEWQEKVYNKLKSIRKKRVISVLGKKLTALPGMFAPLWGDSLLLAKIVRKKTKKGDQVLDLGTGTGIQGIFAAAQASQVLSVDINPKAIQCAKQNALKNHLDDKIRVRKSDLKKLILENKFKKRNYGKRKVEWMVLYCP